MVGIASKNSGISFERITEDGAESSGWVILKIPEGCRRARNILIPIKSPFDYLCAKNSVSVFFDAKTIKSGNFTHSKINQKQIEKLLLLERAGHLAGYLIFLRDKGIVMFAKASHLHTMEKGDHVSDPFISIMSRNGRFDFDLFLKREENGND